jgi:hypothetical protein
MLRKLIYPIYFLIFEFPFVVITLGGIIGVDHVIADYERNQIIELVEKRNEAISMHIMPEQIQEKEQKSWISK